MNEQKVRESDINAPIDDYTEINIIDTEILSIFIQHTMKETTLQSIFAEFSTNDEIEIKNIPKMLSMISVICILYRMKTSSNLIFDKSKINKKELNIQMKEIWQWIHSQRIPKYTAVANKNTLSTKEFRTIVSGWLADYPQKIQSLLALKEAENALIFARSSILQFTDLNAHQRSGTVIIHEEKDEKESKVVKSMKVHMKDMEAEVEVLKQMNKKYIRAQMKIDDQNIEIQELREQLILYELRDGSIENDEKYSVAVVQNKEKQELEELKKRIEIEKEELMMELAQIIEEKRMLGEQKILLSADMIANQKMKEELLLMQQEIENANEKMLQESIKRQNENISRERELERAITPLESKVANKKNELDNKKYDKKELQWLYKQREENEKQKIADEKVYQRRYEIQQKILEEKNVLQLKIEDIQFQANELKQKAIQDKKDFVQKNTQMLYHRSISYQQTLFQKQMKSRFGKTSFTALKVIHTLGHSFPKLLFLIAVYGILNILLNILYIKYNDGRIEGVCSTNEIVLRYILFSAWLLFATVIGMNEYLQCKNMETFGKSIVRVFVLLLFMLEIDIRLISCVIGSSFMVVVECIVVGLMMSVLFVCFLKLYEHTGSGELMMDMQRMVDEEEEALKRLNEVEIEMETEDSDSAPLLHRGSKRK